MTDLGSRPPPDTVPPPSSLRTKGGIEALARIVGQHRDELEAAVHAAVVRIPTFAELFAKTPVDRLEQQAIRARELQRAALEEGEWRPYLDDLRRQGAVYARMGIRFSEWFEIIGAYRRVLFPHLLASGEDLVTTTAAMDDFLDLALSTIGSAYVDEKEAALIDAKSQRDVYIDHFRSSLLGKLVYAWTAPPDLGSFVLVAANPAASRIAGRALEDEIGLRIRDVDETMSEGEVVRKLAEALETGAPRYWELRREIDGRGAFVFEGRAFPLSGGRVGVSFEDVTHKHEITRQLARYVRELERSNRELDDFAYVASHDLKAPLRDIDNLATWIEEDASQHLPDGSRKHLATLRDRIGRMERLLDDLLEYSRAGRVTVPAQGFTASDAIEDAVRLAGPKEGVAVHVSAGDAKLHTPRGPLVQVLRNLVGNALKHHDREDGHVDISVEDRGAELCFAVRDDGPGIAPEFHERIFRMFQTLKPRDRVEGSGMGLALVKKLVEAHGGRVKVESAPGRGSTFSFTWPTRSGEEPTR
jgi:signal transduction histidine kinase